jgi:purine-cytosine permease-like protein
MPRKDALYRELNVIQKCLPPWGARVLQSARKPSAVWLRVPLGIVLAIAGIFGFLPVLGFWMTPLGVALIAIDLPFLRGPMARVLAFLNRKLAAHGLSRVN